MKTAIQELIDIVEMDYNNGVEISMWVFHGMLLKALFKEKQQILDAFDDGQANWEVGVRDFDNGEEYYTKNFSDKKDSFALLCE